MVTSVPHPVSGSSSTASVSGAGGTSAPGKAAPAETNPDKIMVSDINSLKDKAPDVFNNLISSLAQTICNQSKNSSDRISQMRKEYDTTS